MNPNQPFEASRELPAAQNAEDSWGLCRARSLELSNMPLEGLKKSMGMGPEHVDFEWVQVHPTGLVHPSGRMRR